MKRFVVVAAVAILSVSPLIAQDHANHVPAPTAAVATKFSLDTTVETLVADPAAKAVIEANVPGISTHEHYQMFKTMTLNQMTPMAPDKLTPEVLAKIQTGLAAIK